MKILKLIGKILANLILLLLLLFYLSTAALGPNLIFILTVIAGIYLINTNRFNAKTQTVLIVLAIFLHVGYFFFPKTVRFQGSMLGAVEHQYRCQRGIVMSGFDVSCLGSKIQLVQ